MKVNLIKLTGGEDKITEIGYRPIKDIERIFAYVISTSGICHDDKGIYFYSMEDEAFEEDDIGIIYTNYNDVKVAAIRRGLWEGMLDK